MASLFEYEKEAIRIRVRALLILSSLTLLS